ncbi:hypothetical protein K239x_23270 [Planctomycetes bacterium K23_9]|uniref:Uncharacterized protein n=2 Tax=Stieleria marina TaxID=1930275 RepID=A0A517NTC5_9BACT|nr:hypothetical protein K239x_23270 [Planctomycetes bacterium K23_9]
MPTTILFGLHAFVALCLAQNVDADEPFTPDDVFRHWRARQSRTDHVECRLDAIVHYSAETQSNDDDLGRSSTPGRSVKKTVSMQLDGPAKFRFHHEGSQWHQRFGRILRVDWDRFCNGNQYVNLERAYEAIPDWTPRPHVSNRPNLEFMHFGWDDQICTPLLLHYRAFNSRFCPFEKVEDWLVEGRDVVDGQTCILLSGKAFRGGFQVGHYQVWVAPDAEMSIRRLKVIFNNQLAWQYDIDYTEGANGLQPASFRFKRLRGARILHFAKIEVSELNLKRPINASVFELKTYTSAPQIDVSH